MKEWIASSATYFLMNEKVMLQHVSSLQKDFDKTLRTWCKLPANSSVWIFSLPYGEGAGMGTPNLSKMYFRLKAKKFNTIMNFPSYDDTAGQFFRDSLDDASRSRGIDTSNFIGRKEASTGMVKTFWGAVHKIALHLGSFKGEENVTFIDPDEITEKVKSHTIEDLGRIEVQGELQRAWMDNEAVPDVLRSWVPPDGHFQFWAKAFLLQLPTAAYRKRIRGRGDGKCEICGMKKETVLHVLNDCPRRLQDMLFRHDMVLNVILNHRKASPNDEVLVDVHVPGCHYTGIVTKDKPDLFIINRNEKKITIADVAVPYDRGIVKSREGKTRKYTPLVEGVKRKYKDYEVVWTPICIGSLGLTTKELFDELACVGVPKSRVRACTRKMMDAAIRGSFYLWRKRNNPTPDLQERTEDTETLWVDL